jgi:hypothetical protein
MNPWRVEIEWWIDPISMARKIAAACPTCAEKNPNAVALGKLGGSKGGKIRAALRRTYCTLSNEGFRQTMR